MNRVEVEPHLFLHGHISQIIREIFRVIHSLSRLVERLFKNRFLFMASKSKECEKNRPVVVCYNSPAASVVCHQEYNEKRELALKSILRTKITVPRKSARAWVVRKNELCRITVSEGSQVYYFGNIL